MNALARTEPRLRTVWHPAPEAALIETPNITIAVLNGPAQGQLSDASFVEI